MRENYGFEKVDMHGIPGVVRCFVNPDLQMVIAEVDEAISRRCSNSIPDNMQEQMHIFTTFQNKIACHFLLIVWKEQEEDRQLFFSDTKRTRAIEFMDYMISEFGLVKGGAEIASGRISSTILRVQMSGMDIEDSMDYYLDKALSYRMMTQIVEAGEYAEQIHKDIIQLPQYIKKKIPWAYVRSTDIVEEGEAFKLRSLENESGIIMEASPDIYIMIGCRGEAYHITRDKFERTYESADESLDIFEQMLDFIPEVQIMKDNSYVSIDELACLCYPKTENAIYATALDERTKVFPVSEEDYYLGRPGDYLAIRADDITDIYIIQKDIFQQTYERKEQEVMNENNTRSE